MATPGSAEESLQLAEHYRRLTDEELIVLARQKESLTEAAQQTLATEILSRKLTVPPLEPQPSPRPLPPPDIADEDDPYAEDRKLIEISTVWSRADALRLQRVLDLAGIPFYMGSENATGVDDVTSNFAEGVAVRIMSIAAPWVYQAIKNYFPEDEKPEPKREEYADVAIRCPRCRSTDVVFNDLITPAPNRGGSLLGDDYMVRRALYHWTCASCGNEWRDDGVVTQP